MNVITDELLKRLKEVAARECWSDDPEWEGANDYAGGNIDDAYSGGCEDGEAHFAREVLKVLGETW